MYRPTLIYGHEQWILTEKTRSRIQSAEMRFLRRVARVTLRDKTRSSSIHESLQIEPLLLHIERSQLRWLGHVLRMPQNRLPYQIFQAMSTGKRPIGRPRTIPMRASSIDIHPNAKWAQNGLTVAGGNGQGTETNQLDHPFGLYVDDDQTIYVADCANHRIMEWKSGATNGKVVAGANGYGNGAHQLNRPVDVIIHKSDSLIISDYGNNRVVRWPRQNGTRGETMILNIACYGLTMDNNGSLYVVDDRKHEVRRYKMGDTKATVVAGGNGQGQHRNQLSKPRYVFVDLDHSVYVSDWENHRVMKWEEDAKQGIIVAGGQGRGNRRTQLSYPEGVVVDQLGTVYVADYENHRIMRWPKGATHGSVIVGGNSYGAQSNQLNYPVCLSFDRHGNLYVVDWGNHRVQKFDIE
ncbi:unnamed protein product [Rotaria sp. Silwood1]|nr:unnamed protein product [Rotaria sp. Silwood1]